MPSAPSSGFWHVTMPTLAESHTVAEVIAKTRHSQLTEKDKERLDARWANAGWKIERLLQMCGLV